MPNEASVSLLSTTAATGRARCRDTLRPPARGRLGRRNGEAVDVPGVVAGALEVVDQRAGGVEPRDADDEAGDHRHQEAVHQRARC